jgi:hypothetical protein
LSEENNDKVNDDIDFWEANQNQDDNLDFDIDKFLNEIDKIGCKIKHEQEDGSVVYEKD